MQNTSISELTLLEVMDGERAHLGCDQEWFRSWWKRTAGCGPSTFSNIMYYTGRRSGAIAQPYGHGDFVRLMEDVWESVTPGMQGLSSTAMMCQGARDYFTRHGLGLNTHELPVMRTQDGKPSISDAAEFIAHVLSCDTPVAFLALDNGAEKHLDSWHWVTLISLEYDGDSSMNARVLDNGKLCTVDLGLWLTTTTRGGGFVGFTEPAR